MFGKCQQLLPTSWKCWTIFCCISASIAVVNSAVLAQLARANQARVVARQTTQMQMAQARANAAAAAARTRAHALLGPGARLGLARHGGILGDAQRVTRGSGDFFNNENVPTLDQNTLNNDIEDGNNRATTESEQVVLDEQLGTTMDQEAFDNRGNLLSNQGVKTAVVQEPGANCGCKRRIVIIPEETGKDMHHSNCFTVLSDNPVEARMISDQNQDIDMQGSGNLATLSRASSSEIGESEGDAEFSSNQQEAELPLMDVGVIDSQDDAEVGAERFHHGHDLIHKKLHKNQQPTFQNAHQTPVNIHVTQNQHLLVSRSSSADRGQGEEHEDSERNQQPITHNDQVGATQPIDNQARNVEQVTTPAAQTKQVIGHVSEDKTEISGTTSRPLLDAKTDAPSEQVGSIFSQSLNDEQVGMPLSTPSTSDQAIDENDEQVGAPLDDLVEKIEARLSERLGAERTHHIHEMLHKNLHRPQAASHHAQVVAPVNVHVIQNQHAIVAPRMSAADQGSENKEPSSNNSTGVVASTTGPSTPVDKPGSENEHVGASAPNERLDNEEKVGAPAPTKQSDDDEPVGAFLHQNIHGGVFVPRPIVHHGFGLRPAGVIHHNQHSIFGFRSASGEEDGSAAVMEPSNNGTIDVQPQTDRPSETATMDINNGGPRVPENAAQDNIHPSTTVSSEVEDENHLISTTSMPLEKPISHNIEQMTDAKNDDQLGAERTAHLIHKIHNKLHGPTQTRPQTIPVDIHVVQNQGAAMIPRESSDQEAVTAKVETTDAKNDEQVGDERTAHLIHKIHNKLHGPTQTRPQTIPVNIHVTQNQGAVVVPRESSGQEAVTAKVETTDAKNDEQVGDERTAHLIHKIHNKLHGPTQTRPQAIPVNIHVTQNQGAVVVPRESSGQEAVTAKVETTDAKNDEQVGDERTAHLIHKIHNKLHGPPETRPQTIPVNIHVVQNQGAMIPRESSGQETVTTEVNEHLSIESNATRPDSEAPSSARHLNHGLFHHRHEHIHSTGTDLSGISSFLNNFSSGIASNVNVHQNQNANVSPQNPSSVTNVNVVQNQNAAVDSQRPTTFIPSTAAATNVDVFQNQNAAVAPQRPSTLIPLAAGGSTNVEVFQNQNAVVGPQRPTTFIPSSGGSTNVNVFQNQNAAVGQQTTSGFVPVSNFGGASTNWNQGIQSTNIVQDQKAVILPSTSHVGGLSVGTHGYYQGLPSIQKPFGHVSGHASLFQSQSATIGRNADINQAMEDVDVPDLEVKKGNLIDGDDSNADSDEVLGTYLHPHDPYYDNDNPDKTKVIDLIEDKKRIITKMIDSIKEKHDKILDSLKPKLEVKKHKKYYPKPQYPEEPLYHQYPSYAHDYNDQVPDVSWEYDPSYRANSREESDTSISAEDDSIEIARDEISTKEDKRNIDSDSLRFVRSTKANLDNLLKKEEDAVADLKKYVKRDEDLMMIDYVAEKMIDDINQNMGLGEKRDKLSRIRENSKDY
ncbi:unnamed protein product [Callosobruchus maculatus]|uniref:Uncharacterized protein n=1 Tax=Callosobruchus maculatus TaxID=64391 RepID=A0A653CQP8_CALMS|nr:unnamed protein product [Callosobruchus maculatus]